MNTSHFGFNDREFENEFASNKLDPNLFTHEAHLRLAWIHINEYGLEIAILNLKSQLKRYVAQLGQEDKYNDTITEAATRAVYHFIMQSKSDTFVDFIKEFPQLKENFRELMLSHYSEDMFAADEAKDHFIEPDLLPFD